MLPVRNLFHLLSLRFVIGFSQINLDLTDRVSNSNGDAVSQHDCVHVPASVKRGIDPYQILSYCMSEWPTKWTIRRNSHDRNFTFVQLMQQNITSAQLYRWSAPMDVVERYQLYLNQHATENDIAAMETRVFYNCTSPRFGPLCQYSLDAHEFYHSSLNEIISDFYLQDYLPTTLTCYMHLQCDRDHSPACLDWSDICDGTVDCQNGIDEEPCWQLEINVCKENEYQCLNGQCIPDIFRRDDPHTFECLDQSDESHTKHDFSPLLTNEPTFAYEDVTCPVRQKQHDVKLTSSCLRRRHDLLLRAKFFSAPESVSNECWSAFKCFLKIPDASDPTCSHLCADDECKRIINETCPDTLYIPSSAIVFGHIHFVYITEDIQKLYLQAISAQYVCYNEQLCSGFQLDEAAIALGNSTCRRPEHFPLQFNSFAWARGSWKSMYLIPIYNELSQCNTIMHNDPIICSGSAMYRCVNSSKCIAKNRVCDGVTNCDHGDDEQNCGVDTSCLGNGANKPFKCTTTNFCIPQYLVGDKICNCPRDRYNMCDDERPDTHYIRKHIQFPTICDGFTELLPVLIDGRNETDETECEHWQCNNSYTRCDGFWNCFNGADEIDCEPSPPLNCADHHHLCVSPKTNHLMCLSLNQTNDGKIDCLGATDEPKLCRANNYRQNDLTFHCTSHINDTCIAFSKLCIQSKCQNRADTQFCDLSGNRTYTGSFCDERYQPIRSDVERFLCDRLNDTGKPEILHFSLDERSKSVRQRTAQNTDVMISRSSNLSTTRRYQQHCHRGLAVHVWLDSERNLSEIACLCPPSFYGNRCQYQNQRVSMTLQFRVFSDSLRTLFSMVISLVDDSDERIIHSYQQFTYLYIRDCQKKFNIYLLYATRSINKTTKYAVHIDIYESVSLRYRGSLLVPLTFTFLPVYRVAVQLDIPRIRDDVEGCSVQGCIHGQCIQYANNPNDISFCQCHRGWSGRYCNILQTKDCNCSSDSLWIGIAANGRPLCVCPIDKWGSHCLLQKTICQSSQNTTCQNGARCVPTDEYMVSDKKFVCICSKGFTGERCEIADTIITVSFDKDTILPQSVFFHFIRQIANAPPENGSTFKSITSAQETISVSWSRPFHVAFAELPDKTFHLIAAQKSYNQSATIVQTISSFNRCKHISELFNDTVLKYHLLRRIKYYHLPCQTRSSPLTCFYDDIHFCLCTSFGLHRVANCFEFNHTKKHDCFGKSNCQNEAQCLQDKATCPQTSICVCRACFYGARCQFSSQLFGLSLDAVLGYHIQPNIGVRQQSSIVQTSVVLTALMTLVGLVNGGLCLLTFKGTQIAEMGSDFYLLSLSMNAILITIMFALKFVILVIAQMTYITHRSFLQFQCHSVDFLLQICLHTGQWLNACVAIDRTAVVTKGVSFDKRRSRKMAKYVVITLLVTIIGTTIHDPLHRRLITDDDDDDDDDNNKRIWCIVTYSSTFQLFNSVVNVFHFFVPFILNLISAPIILTVAVRQRKIVHPKQSYRNLIREQFQRYSHLFVTPFILLVLALPRLIISFIAGCMTSNGNPWLLLIGYLISFIPSMVTYFVFVCPSQSYKRRFRKNIEQHRQRIRTRLCLAPNRLM